MISTLENCVKGKFSKVVKGAKLVLRAPFSALGDVAKGARVYASPLDFMVEARRIEPAYALRASAGLAHIRSLRPCSAKRATGTFCNPRNASGVRFSVTLLQE